MEPNNIHPEHTNQELTACKAQLESCQATLMRTTADFQNFKKRMEKEQGQWIEGAQADMLKNLLPIIDDIERALAESRKKTTPDLQVWIQGLEMIHTALYKFLKKYGVEEIPVSGTFDPEKHEALASLQVPDKKAGEIVETLQKGYTLKGNVLRVAHVTVAQATF